MSESLAHFFHRVTKKEILPYQMRYGAEPFTSTLMIIPTGLGKTEAVLIPWIHAIACGHTGTPTRLAFVLPRQNLTEQTARRARSLAEDIPQIKVLELMGGSDDSDLTLSPDQPAILVGTQDILISRALNRGYARRPPRWPIDFALLNNDCLWVIDEVQLTSDSLATSTQLAAFREKLGVFGRVPCVWMSATVNPQWLDTVDFKLLRPALRIIKLEEDDRNLEIVRARIHAAKQIAQAPEQCRTPEGCAEFVLAQHKSGERTLVIVNTVLRAREIFAELKRCKAEPLLLHSRFRPGDRRQRVAALDHVQAEGQIIVSTQVLEAGIDLSSHRLITDVAPWGSIVQRCGRVNRFGEHASAQIWWVDQPLTSKRKSAVAPYSADEIESAIAKVCQLHSAAPADLPVEDGNPPWKNVLRRSDLLDLFDTSSDSSGNELDVSRFIRSRDETDCYVAWRNCPGDEPPIEMPEVDDSELCPAPVHEVRDLTKRRPFFVWNFVSRKWSQLDRDRLYPGMILIARGQRWRLHTR